MTRCLRPNVAHSGRPTLCQRPLEWYQDACSSHATTAELEAALQRLRAGRSAPAWEQVPLPLGETG